MSAKSSVPWDALRNSTVVVTGATGLIGGAVVDALLKRNDDAGDSICVVVPARDEGCILRRFPGRRDVRFVSWDASSVAVPDIPECDFIIHCAAPTASLFFVEHPVETIAAIVDGSRSMLELARATKARMVQASSMEVYGALSKHEPVREDEGGPLDAMNTRSSYPQAKQLAETLCAAYASECGVQVCVARLAQTFGAGVRPDDGRVFAHIARSVVEGKDVVLATSGNKGNMYVSLVDAVDALLVLVTVGESGEAYNVANESTYCTIKEMAKAVLERFGAAGAKVVVGQDAGGNQKYRPSTELRMDSSKLRALGWTPTLGLVDMYAELLESWENDGSTCR